MVKKKKVSTSSKNDTRVATVVLGIFVAAIILFFVLSKGKEPHKEFHRETHKVVHKVFYKEQAPESQEEAVEVPVSTQSRESNESNESSRPIESTPQPLTHIPGSGGKIAIILDDWGQTTVNCKYLKEIPEPLAVSILPGLRHTKDVAECAALYHKLAMLHLPLEAVHNSDYYPPDYIIKTTMKPALVSKIVDEDLDQLPSIEGVNNHMGSKATADRPLMKIILKKLKRKGLFFVDSMTSHNSVSAALADEMGLSYGKRDVFLDNVNTKEAITRQFVALAQKARHRGYAVAIGHDRHVTMQVLKEEIPWLESQGFQIVSIKELLKNK